MDHELEQLMRDHRSVGRLMTMCALETVPAQPNPTDQSHQDRIELEQYREIFKKLDALMARNGEIHIVPNLKDRIVIRLIDNDGPVTFPGEHPTGATLRDAMAQAARSEERRVGKECR